MFVRFLLSISVAGLVLLLCDGKRQWDYEPLSIETSSSDDALMKIEARVEREGRGDYFFSGNFKNNIDMGENAMVEATAFRSSTGSEDDYKLLPWSVPKQSWSKFVESYYADIVFKNLNTCSNLPEPDNADPLPKNTYKFDKCVVAGEGMPEIAPEGYYKVIFTVSGPVDAGFVAIVKLTTKNSMVG